MELRILGSLEVWDGGHRIRIGSPLQRRLLALLTIHANEAISTDRMIDALWVNPPRSGLGALQFHVWGLRTALGEAAGHLATRSPGYVLEIPPESIDAVLFERLGIEGHRLLADAPKRALQVLEEGLALWRGPALAEFEYESFARGEIARLEARRLTMVEDRLDAELRLGRAEEVVGELDALVDEFPLQERLWGLLMTALYRCGRQADALRAYQRARAALGDVGIEPSEELRQLEEQMLMGDPRLQSSVPLIEPRHNLPNRISRFVDREEEINRLVRRLRDHRLVTVHGLGGVGKTSLAIEMAHRCVDDWSGGVWLVDLAAVTDGALVDAVVTNTLGIDQRPGVGPRQSIIAALRSRTALLILDNCEHLVEAAAVLIDRILSTCAGVSILATSRDALRVAGELVFDVAPLPVPDAEILDVATVRESAAVALLEDRARLVADDFCVTAENLGDVLGLVTAVGGVPLGIELAAARLHVYSLHELSESVPNLTARRSQRTDRSSDERHQSLTATLDWSHRLLGEDEQALLRRIGVFAGAFSLDEVAVVCAGDPIHSDDVPELMTSLVEQSWIHRTGDDVVPFRLLVPVRTYALDRLAADDELETSYRALVGHLTDVGRRAEAALEGGRAEDASALWRRLAANLPNLRSALTWCVDRVEAPLGLELATAVSGMWWQQGWFTEARAWFDRLFGLEPPASASLAVALLEAGGMAGMQGERAVEAHLAQLALTMAEEIDDVVALRGAVTVLAFSSCRAAEFQQSIELFTRSIAICRDEGVQAGLVTAYGQLAYIAAIQGDYVAAESHLGSLNELAATYDLDQARFAAWGTEAVLQLWGGDFAQAELRFQQCEEIHRRSGDRNDMLCEALLGSAEARLGLGDLVGAETAATQGLEIARDAGLPTLRAYGLRILGEIARRRSDLAVATPMILRAIEIAAYAAVPVSILGSLQALVLVLVDDDRRADASSLLNAVEVHGSTIGVVPSAYWRTEIDSVKCAIGEPDLSTLESAHGVPSLDVLARQVLDSLRDPMP